MLRHAAQIMRRLLCHPEVSKDPEPVEGRLVEGCIPMLDGVGGISLFVPVADGPSYPDVRSWAHAIARKAIAAHPELFSEAPNTHADGRVHIHVSHNAENLFSILPYSFRSSTQRVATPVTWEEAETFDMLGIPLDEFPARVSAEGDIFGSMLAHAHAVSVPCHAEPVEAPCRPESTPCHPEVSKDAEPVEARYMLSKSSTKRAPILNEVTQILWDGKPRTAQEILDEGRAKSLFGPYNEEMLKSHLIDYINRTRGRGLEPSIVMDGDEKFRINEPLDAWPNVVPSNSAPRSTSISS